MVNRIPLSVAGFSLTVNTEEDRAYVEALAKTLEKDMLALMEGPANATGSKAAVVCAIDYCDKLQKANSSAINMRNQIRDYLADAASAKLIIDEREKTIEKLSHQLADSTPSERMGEITAQLAAEKEKNTLLYRELDKLTADYDQASERAGSLAAAESRCAQLEQANERLTAELYEAKERAGSGNAASGRISELEAKNERLISELYELSSAHSELEARLQQLTDDLEDMTEDSRQLRDQNLLLSSQKDSLISRAAAAEEQSELLRRQLETLEQMIDEEGGAAKPQRPATERDIIEELEPPRGRTFTEGNLPDLDWTNEVI